MIKDNDYKSFLEIGVWKGENILSIAKTFPGVLCYGIDPYDFSMYDNQNSIKDDKSSLLKSESELIFVKIQSEASKFENFYIIRKPSIEASKDYLDNSIDLIFIDANHSYNSVKNDISTWLPKVRAGGCISGHDYSLKFFGVIQAVNEVLGFDNIVIQQDSTWFYFKN